MTLSLQDAAALSDIASGLATVAAVLLAVREVHRWREQRVEENKSIAAARSLVALTRAREALVAWTTPLEDVTGVNDPDLDFVELGREFEATDRKGRAEADSALRDLRAATVEAYVHLENEQVQFLSNVASMSAEVREAVDSMLTELECVPPGQELEVLRRMREALRNGRLFVQNQLETGSKVLLPIARFKR